MNTNRSAIKTSFSSLSTRAFGGVAAIQLACSLSLFASPPPTGVAPVTVPAGGFSIGGELASPGPAGDWLPGPGGTAGVLDTTGAPLNPATTLHFVDAYNSSADDVFAGGLKWYDNPNTWSWVSSGASSKNDLNNVLLHIATDSNQHTWLIVAADRQSTSGSSYIDFEFLQNTLVRNSNGTFASAGPDGGRTQNDLLLTLAFTSGGSAADFYAYRWSADGQGGFTYADSTSELPSGRVFVAANTNTLAEPFGAFGQTTYAPNAFAEAAVDLTALMGNFDPCLSIGVKTIMIKTKTSPSSSASIVDFIDPIQFSLHLGPSANAGPNQTQCSQGVATDFSLQGQTTAGDLPIVSTTWTVVSGTALIDSPTSLNTTAHVSSPTATVRLTAAAANGCIKTSDVVLTVASAPTSSISGPASASPLASVQFTGPAGMSSYAWSIQGNGSIVGSASSQTVAVNAGSACNANFTLVLNVMSNTCSSASTNNVLVMDTVPPTVTAPPDVALECPANTAPAATGIAVAQDNSGHVTVTYNDSVSPNCGGSKVITRTWTATDLCGNTAAAVQTITVRDTTPPTVTAPANVSLSFTGDVKPSATGVATAQDGCSSVTVSYTDAVAVKADGTQVITRTWVATDACGNSASTAQTITLGTPAALVLPAQTDVVLTNLTTLTVTNTATNPYGPNPITYQLINPPAGATIDTNGVITWTPTLAQSPSTNLFITVVTSSVDTSVASSTITSTNSFVVIVTSPYDGLNLNAPSQTQGDPDADGDGLSNLLEYAVGSNPNDPADANTGIIVWLTQDSGNSYVAMKFKRRTNAASLSLQYLSEVSADKQTWTGDAANVLLLDTTSLDAQFDWVTVRDLTPVSSTAPRFIRLRVISGN